MLPSSIIHEILLKLPINSITRFKSVCKSWHELISDTYFANLYFKNPPSNDIALLKHRTFRNNQHDQFSLLEIGKDGCIMNTPFIPNPYTFQEYLAKDIVGSCNGLFCLLVSNTYSELPNQTVWIWNPLRQKHLVLPVFQSFDHFNWMYGFGSNIGSDDYKVIRLRIKYEIGVVAQILTIGVDYKWRDIDVSFLPDDCEFFQNGVAVNGVLHWYFESKSSYPGIFGFDIGDEEGDCISLPHVFSGTHSQVNLAVWDGHLCLSNNSSKVQVEIWKMTQYGVEESWTRDIIVRSSILCYDGKLIPITTMRNGDLMLFNSHIKKLFSFDPKTKNCFEIGEFDVEGIAVLFGYVPSLFSVDTFCKQNV